jgi:hypothetical protein
VAVVLQDVLVRVVQEALSKRKTSPSSDWSVIQDAAWGNLLIVRWQPLEAMLALLGAIGDDIRGILEEDASIGLPPTIQLAQLYSEVVADLMQDGRQSPDPFRPSLADFAEQPAIQGRAFIFAGSFAGVLPKPAVEAAFNATVQALRAGIQDVAVQFSAVKAIKL